MGQIKFKTTLIAVILFFMALSQVIPIVSNAATIDNGAEFFTNRPNNCMQVTCDALLQWGIYSDCVYVAANAGDFFWQRI
jgi:hypothetical protein